MGSLNRHIASERISRIYDTAVAAQGDAKGMKAHAKSIRGAVEPKGRQAAEGMQEFLNKARAPKGGKRG